MYDLFNRLILFESLYCTLKCRNLLDMYIWMSNIKCRLPIFYSHCALFYVLCALCEHELCRILHSARLLRRNTKNSILWQCITPFVTPSVVTDWPHCYAPASTIALKLWSSSMLSFLTVIWFNTVMYSQ